MWVGFSAAVVLACSRSTWRVPPARARRAHARGPGLVGRVDRSRARVQPRRVRLVRPGARGRVPDRLPDREGALGRQPVRVRRDLLVLRGAGGAAAPRAVLGHPRRARAARGCSSRLGAALLAALPLADLRVRRVPGLHRRASCSAHATRRCTPSATRSMRSVPALRADRSPSYHGARFFVRRGRPALATPLLMVVAGGRGHRHRFAVDSIPAIFARHARSVHRVHARTSSRSSACARCTSCSPTCCSASTT